MTENSSDARPFADPQQSRVRFITALGSSALLTACAGGDMLSTLGRSEANKFGRNAMSVPAGYTTTHSVGTSSLYYNGSLVATLTTDQTTFRTKLYYAPTNTTYEESSGTFSIGGQYSPYPGANCSFPASTQCLNTSGGGNGSYTLGTNSQGYYQGTLYHSIAIPQSTTQIYGIKSGDGGGCTKPPCPLSTTSCIIAATLAIGTTLAFALEVAGAIANPVFGAAEVGLLVLTHGLAVAEITNAVGSCLNAW